MKALHPLTFAIAVLLGTSFLANDAHAQRSARDRADRAERAERGDDEAAETVSEFPNATRVSPPAESTPRMSKPLKKLQDAYDAGDKQEEAIAAAEEVLANEHANDYDKGISLLMAGSAALDIEDYARATDYLERAIAGNALPNDNHFNAMQILAQVYFNDEKYDKSVELLTRVIAESGTTNPQTYLILGASYYNQEKYEESIEPLKKAIELDTEHKDTTANQMLMSAYDETGRGGEAIATAEALYQASPDDKRALLNLVTLYGQQDMEDKAVALLDQARAKGMISTVDDYKRLYATYFNLQREADAAIVIQEGLDKNVLPADGETYRSLAQAYYFSDNLPAAIAAAQKGAPLATDGQLSLFLAQILNQEDRNAESIAAARAALAKGLEKPGEAWMVIARAEFYSENIAGAKAAFQEAAKDPSTRSQAQTELAKLNR
jgi:tetratricopeptide (TPR) repeat protein